MARVLFVEDEEPIALATKAALEQERHVVDHCSKGEDAEMQIRSVDYDILILDWGLPDTTGLEICTSYRRAGGTARCCF
jgi:DNA-binding response OmpR family regulator